MAESMDDFPLLFLPTKQVSGAKLKSVESRKRRKFSSLSFKDGRTTPGSVSDIDVILPRAGSSSAISRVWHSGFSHHNPQWYISSPTRLFWQARWGRPIVDGQVARIHSLSPQSERRRRSEEHTSELQSPMYL